MERDEMSLKLNSLLRRAGLDGAPRAVIVCAGVLCLALVVLAVLHFWPGGEVSGEFSTTGGKTEVPEAASGQGPAGESDASLVSSSASSEEARTIAVDIEGAVRAPGVYELPAGSRVVDVVELAGGLSRSAARTSVNLAQKLEDGTQVYVATKKEAGGTTFGQAGGSGGSLPSATSNGSPSKSSTGSQKVNINTASAEELQTLSGIGPSLSQRIVDYREKNGPFASVEDLKKVSGIGDTRLAAIRDSVCT